MLELFLKAIDRLITLLRIREKRLAFRYNEIYKPAFAELEAVHLDYLKGITALRSAVTSLGENHQVAEAALLDAAKMLAERRIVLAPARAKLARFFKVVDSAISNISESERWFLASLSIYFGMDEATDPHRKTQGTEHQSEDSDEDTREDVSVFTGLRLTLEEAVDELRRLQFEAALSSEAPSLRDTFPSRTSLRASRVPVTDQELDVERVRLHVARDCDTKLILLEARWVDVIDWYNKLRFEISRNIS